MVKAASYCDLLAAGVGAADTGVVGIKKKVISREEPEKIGASINLRGNDELTVTRFSLLVRHLPWHAT